MGTGQGDRDINIVELDQSSDKRRCSVCSFTLLNALLWTLLFSFTAGGIYFMLPGTCCHVEQYSSHAWLTSDHSHRNIIQ